MRILALESSAVAASACIQEDGKILGEFYSNTRQTHSQTLLPMVRTLLRDTGTQVKDLDLLAVSAGPARLPVCASGLPVSRGWLSPMIRPAAVFLPWRPWP